MFKSPSLLTFRKVKKVTVEGGPKMAKIQVMGKNFGTLGLLFGQRSASNN